MKGRSVRWFLAGYLSYLAAPIILLLIGSFGESWTNTLLPSGITDRWYLEIWADGSFRRAFSSSLIVCGATCVVTVLIAVPFAYAIHSAASRQVRIATRILYLLPIAAPSLVLGFGFVLVFSSDSLPFLGASWLLVAGHVIVALPYMMQVLIADMRHLDLDTLEAAAESLGASFFARFFHIVLPSLLHSMVAGTILVATLSIGEFQLTNIIAGFLTRTYPIVLLQAFYGATGFACAGTIVLIILAILGAVSSAAVGRGATA
jgi:putative spermidine/putrescine transport system permease protein